MDTDNSVQKYPTATKKIFIVEDDEDVGALLVQAVEQETAYQAVLASDGFQALKMLRTAKPDVLILDYGLPEGKRIASSLNVPLSFVFLRYKQACCHLLQDCSIRKGALTSMTLSCTRRRSAWVKECGVAINVNSRMPLTQCLRRLRAKILMREKCPPVCEQDGKSRASPTRDESKTCRTGSLLRVWKQEDATMASDKDGSSSWEHPHRRPPQVERSINQFLDAACDESRRAILELLVPPMGQDSPDGYELRAGEIAQQLGLANSTTSEHLHLILFTNSETNIFFCIKWLTHSYSKREEVARA